MSDLIDRQVVKEQMLEYGFTAPDMTVTEFIEDCLPSAQHKITREDVEEYCRTRCMVLVTSDLFKEMNTRWSRPEIIYCKNCKFTDGKKPTSDGRYWCVLHSCFMDYCSRAERREE